MNNGGDLTLERVIEAINALGLRITSVETTMGARMD